MFNGKTYIGEEGYIELLSDVLHNGVDIPDRTDVGMSRALFDAKLIYPEGMFPFSTFRPAPFEKAFKEFWFFMNGKTQTKELEAQGVNFWVGNTTRDFLDNRGLNQLEEGDMGMAYGYQWRSYNKGLVSPENEIDQLIDTVETLKKDRYSRRVYTTFWNPSASKYMALTPCWHSHQFVILPNEKGEDTLHLKLISRSLDVLFGASYALMQYKAYQMCIAKLLKVNCGTLSCDLTQHHLYHNQLEYTKEAIQRPLGKQGTLEINKELNSIEDILSMEYSDFEIKGLEVNTTKFINKLPKMAA